MNIGQMWIITGIQEKLETEKDPDKIKILEANLKFVKEHKKEVKNA